MFDLRACFAMGWVSYVDFDGPVVRITLTNGNVHRFSRTDFRRMYNWKA